MLGFIPLAATAIPAIIPPPPIGQSIVSTFPSNCSSISRPIVPCPAITYLSLNGCKKVAPVLFVTQLLLRKHHHKLNHLIQPQLRIL